jgi:ABC-type antimicrobial peptide transport system permease subunit
MMQALEVVPRFSSRVIHDRVQRLARSQVDPLVEAGWRALLFIAFGAVLILSCLGFLVHAYVSFRNRQLEFALLRTVGFSIRQLTVMVWLEQMLVIGTGLALGTWMGGRLGEIIMPFLGHDDWGDQVIPPFVMKVNWGALLITYAIMAVVFAGITLALIWLIHRISLQRTLRLGYL